MSRALVVCVAFSVNYRTPNDSTTSKVLYDALARRGIRVNNN
jgi:hypothetical protein